jgi:aspartate 1-decarboxylase
MFLSLLKGKLHRARVTHAEPDYEGSCAIDAELLEAAGILAYEEVQIYNVDNGERFTTYAILAEVGSRIVSVNGAAAHRAAPGGRVIICAFAAPDASEAARYKPRLVLLDENNRIKQTRDSTPVQAA